MIHYKRKLVSFCVWGKSDLYNLGLLENIKSNTPSLYLPNPKTFNFWGSATEWLGDYDYVFPVIILYLIKEYKNKGVISYEKYVELLNYYFQM